MTERLSSARRSIKRERRKCVDEREAFRAFRRQVADLTPAQVTTNRRMLLSDRAKSSGSLDRVREAYESTVMSVPHHEREYGDSYEESLLAEFGDDVAAAIFGSRTLTAELRDALIAAARTTAAERTEFIDLLDREAESVAVADEELDELFGDLRALDSPPLPDRSFDELVELRTALLHTVTRLDQVAARRQETLSSHRRSLAGSDVDVTEYLYSHLDATYPVLATVAEFGDLVKTATRRVERALASTP